MKKCFLGDLRRRGDLARQRKRAAQRFAFRPSRIQTGGMIRACFKNGLHCRSRRKEARNSTVFAEDQSLLTSAPTIFKTGATTMKQLARILCGIAAGLVCPLASL